MQIDDKSSGIEVELDGNEDILPGVANHANKRGINRECFRIPCGGPDDCIAVIDGNHYELINIGSQGIGIRCSPSPTLIKGRIIKKILLIIQNTSFTVQGRIAHLSPCVDGGHLCGIELIHLNPDTEKRIRVILIGRRQNLFGRVEK